MMFQIKELLPLLNSVPFRFIGNDKAEINDVVSFKHVNETNSINSLSWVNDKNAENFSGALTLGLLIVNEAHHEKFLASRINLLITEHPRLLFLEVLKRKFSQRKTAKIEPSAFIDPSSKIGVDTYVGRNVVIEEDCVIGNNCEILHNTVILKNTIIGDNVRIGCNCTIGNFGFGYEKNLKGDYELIEHIGNVVIHSNVDIHNNTCIDRAVMGSTIIEEQVRIDNLVHIAHGVHLKRNALIIANAMIAGSTVIGENSWIAPSVSVKNQLTIAKNTMTGIAAVVLKDTTENSTVIGNPASTMDEAKKWSTIKKKLLEG
jgi:UDP-3-O-[3-hydroxymyristoyl] glucosamine N-acyltransferase